MHTLLKQKENEYDQIGVKQNNSSDSSYKNLTLQVPVLIAAKNESLYIKNTLAHIVKSVISYKKLLEVKSLMVQDSFIKRELEMMQCYIFICDNNSQDKTYDKICEFQVENIELLNQYKIKLFSIKEYKPGKLNALKSLLILLDTVLQDKYDHIILTDAEIEWAENVYSELLEFKLKNPAVKLIGTNILPKNRKISIWGRFELIPYYGYGDNNISVNGQGLFMKFVSGMGYLADKNILYYLKDEIPPIIGNEDVAISMLVGKESIHILNNTAIYYYVSNNIKEFFTIRGRHVRELYRLRRWLRIWKKEQLLKTAPYLSGKNLKLDFIANKWAKRRFFEISENRLLYYFIKYYTNIAEFKFTKKGIADWFKNIPIIKGKVVFVFPLSLLIYGIINIIAYIQSFLVKKEGWETNRF